MEWWGVARKAPKPFSYELASSVLVEAEYYSDARAARRWGVSPKSVYNWRLRMIGGDAKLSAMFHQKKDAFDTHWHMELVKALCAGADFLQRAAMRSKYDPEYVHAIMGGMKIVGEVSITRERFNSDYDRALRPDRSAGTELAASADPGETEAAPTEDAA